MAVLDASPLPNGELLVAFGEAGLAVLDASGRVVRRWSEPAHALVVPRDGGLAVAIAHRGTTLRAGRIDLVTGEVRGHWELPQLVWDSYCNQGVWWVVRDRRLHLIDLLADAWASTWSTSVPGPCVGLTSREASLIVALDGNDVDLWQYKLWGEGTTDILREILPANADYQIGTSADANALEWVERVLAFRVADVGPHDFHSVHCFGEWAAVVMPECVGVFDRRAEQWRARLDFDGSSQIGVRLDDAHLTAFDEFGRVFCLDLRHGDVLADVAVRL
jgi:hypothetical protein